MPDIKIPFKELSRHLEFNEIDFLPKTIYKSGDLIQCTVLAYKDARVDMKILDEVVTPELWQNEFKRDSKGCLQCGIGIYNASISSWIWKWSNGTPSEYEAEKGEYSDALKRAGFMWGIGRHLYDFPSLKVTMNEKEYELVQDKYKAKPWFQPNSFKWSGDWNEKKNIYENIIAKDRFGNIRFSEKIPKGAPRKKETKPENIADGTDPLERIKNCKTKEELNKLWAVYPKWHESHKDAFSKRKLELL